MIDDIERLLSVARDHEHYLVTKDLMNARTAGSSAIAWFNKRIAIAITSAVGTMWCAYAFCLLALVSLPPAIASHNLVTIVSWISQTFLQLVLLSIIIVGQNLLSDHAEKRAEADHETLQLLHQINTTQLEILNKLETQISLKIH